MGGNKVYLVPGFFGFTSLGALSYFYGVRELLSEQLAAQGIEAEVIECSTRPTASIPRRALWLLDDVTRTGGLEASSVHFVGHSTGGLDIRLLLTPGVQLSPDRREPTLAARTRSAITVATPHFGTPLAGFFTTVAGRQLLEALTIAATTTGGRYALYAAAQTALLVTKIDDWLGRRETFLDVWARRLLAQVSRERDHELWEFLRAVSQDQGAIIQLTPESMHLYNAAVVDHPDIPYSCVVTAAPPPPGQYEASQLLSLGRAGLAGAFTLLSTLASREHRHYRYPHPGSDLLDELAAQYRFQLSPQSNDGIVPVLSQIYGRVLTLVTADHLDVCGQYHRDDDPHRDWLPSGSGYDDQRFRQTWEQVAREIAASTRGIQKREALA
jgi:hypothetical protein